LLYNLFWTGLKRLKSNQNILEDFPPVSVIVAARNEELFLPGLLSALAKQDYPVDKLEIIVADDRSTDKHGNVSKITPISFPIFGVLE
jgi:cellulose synthase/poly-beta-1,6-N-acetylglucosamine synthase-like glycosyltransferase